MKKRLIMVLVLVTVAVCIGVFAGCDTGFVSAEKKWKKASEKSAITTLEIKDTSVTAMSQSMLSGTAATVVIERNYKAAADGSTDAFFKIVLSKFVVGKGPVASFLGNVSPTASIEILATYNTLSTKLLMETHGRNFDGKEDSNPENIVEGLVLNDIQDDIKGQGADLNGLKPFVDFVNAEIESLHLYKFDSIKKIKSLNGQKKATFYATNNEGVSGVLDLARVLIKNAGYLTLNLNNKDYTVNELIKKVAGSTNIIDYMLTFINMGDVDLTINNEGDKIKTAQVISGRIDKSKMSDFIGLANELFPGMIDKFSGVVNMVVEAGMTFSVKILSDTTIKIGVADMKQLVETPNDAPQA